MSPVVKIATQSEYWGDTPDQSDFDSLADAVREIAPGATVEFVPETSSWGNRNDEEGQDILDRAWSNFCGQ